MFVIAKDLHTELLKYPWGVGQLVLKQNYPCLEKKCPPIFFWKGGQNRLSYQPPKLRGKVGQNLKLGRVVQNFANRGGPNQLMPT